jgi:hypothetical protein
MRSIQRYLRAFLARRRWRKALLLAYPDKETFIDDADMNYLKGYRDGVASTDLPLADQLRLRLDLDRRFGQRENAN